MRTLFITLVMAFCMPPALMAQGVFSISGFAGFYNPSLGEFDDFYNNFDGFQGSLDPNPIDVQAEGFGSLAWFGGLLSYEDSQHISLRLEAGFWEDEAHAQSTSDLVGITTRQEQEIQIVPLLVGSQYNIAVGQGPLRLYLGGYVGAIHIQDDSRIIDMTTSEPATTMIFDQQMSFWELAVKPFVGIEVFPLNLLSLSVETGFVISEYSATVSRLPNPGFFPVLEEISLNGLVMTAVLRYNFHLR